MCPIAETSSVNVDHVAAVQAYVSIRKVLYFVQGKMGIGENGNTRNSSLPSNAKRTLFYSVRPMFYCRC